MNSETISFASLDKYLICQRGKIIHQVWFDNIKSSKRKSKKLFESLEKFRESWLEKNPDWVYVLWNVDRSLELMKTHYPEYMDLYKSYTYNIQRCDVIRYFILHRYGGLYADMDYFCNKSFTEALKNFPCSIYFVQTPNVVSDGNARVSNSLMYSEPNHPFWKSFFLELEKVRDHPCYWSRHIIIMYTTGPGVLNRAFYKYKIRYSIRYFPYKLFHPHGIGNDILSLRSKSDVYAIHLGKGSWETADSKFLIFIYTEYKILIFIVTVLLLPLFLSRLFIPVFQ